MRHTLSSEDKIYLSGLFDGEGYIGTTSRFGLRAQIAMTHYQTMAFFARAFDKRLTEQRRPNQKPLYTLAFSGIEAAKFIREIRPWLRVKASQAEIALRLAELRQQNHHVGRLETINKDAQEQCALLLKELKQEEKEFELPIVEQFERPIRHGTRFGYQQGCKCSECRAANAEAARALRKKRADLRRSKEQQPLEIDLSGIL